MREENDKYKIILEALRRSNPSFNDAEGFADRVIRQVSKENSSYRFRDLILEFFFGWVYIGWVRRSMVMAALAVLVFFGYQQTLILQKIKVLPVQKIQSKSQEMNDYYHEFSNSTILYQIKDKKFPIKLDDVSEKEIDQLIKSINKLEVKYRDIFYQIENDPELKKYVEQKLNENIKNQNLKSWKEKL